MFDLPSVDRPYPGLRPFEPHESAIFFGRDGHTDRLLEILQRERFLAVVGPSGSGKSSLVRAGLLPALAGGRLGTGSHWRLALMRPGSQPLLALAQALTSRHALGIELGVALGEPPAPLADATPLLPASADEATADAAVLAAELRRGPDGLDRLLAQAQAARLATAGRPDDLPTLNLLLLADQFEEVFTYREAATDPGEATRFVDMLLRASGSLPEQAPGIRVVVALTMRTDFLGHCVEFDDLPEAINRAQYLTPRLQHDELHAAIVGPARLFDGDVAPGFAEATIADTGRDGDQLPLLQHALAQWWIEARRVNAASPLIDQGCTQVAGTMHEALNRHADRLYDALAPAEQRACEWLFRAITTGREGADAVRRPQRLGDIAAWSGSPDDTGTLMAVVRKLAASDVSFVRHGATLTVDSVIDLTHEALMRQWRSLAGWVIGELRRAQGWRRWHACAVDHAAGDSELLSGAELARALDWWDPGPSSGDDRDGWAPTAAWCSRYVEGSAEPAEATRQWQQLRDFIVASRDAVRDAVLVERQRVQDEAKRLERERGQWWLRLSVAVGLVVSGGLCAVALALSSRADQARSIATSEGIKASAAREVARAAEHRASQAEAQAAQKLRQVSLLSDYWDPGRLGEALAADTAIRAILARSTAADAARRQAITLEVFAKDIDQSNVRSALAKLGFKMSIRQPKLAEDATNAVWAGTPVSADDTRLVALGLIRAGIAVRSVGPIQEWISGRDRNVLQAGATQDSVACRPWTVVEIVAATAFTRETRRHCA